MQIPIIRFVRSGSALLTRDIIPAECVLVNNFFASQEQKNTQKMDQYWDEMAKNLMMAFCFLLYHEAPEEEQNLATVLQLLQDAEISDEDGFMSPVDMIFAKLEKEKPGHIAVGYYKD